MCSEISKPSYNLSGFQDLYYHYRKLTNLPVSFRKNIFDQDTVVSEVSKEYFFHGNSY